MKTFNEPRKRIFISSDDGTVFTNHEYALIRRIASVIELHDMDATIQNIVSESMLKKTA
jgi:hypothetical protein